MGRRRSERRWGLAGAIASLVALAGVAPAANATPTSPNARELAGTTASTTSVLVPVGPVRLADTRRVACGCERSAAESTIVVDVTGHPDVPDGAVAAAVTVTATRTPVPGYVTVFPAGAPRPATSTVNSRPDRVASNTTIVPLAADGRLSVFLSRPGDVVIDLSGVFVPADRSRAGRYVPVAGQRLADTRTADPPSGPIGAGGELTVPLPGGIDTDAIAVVVNLTHLGEPAPGYVTIRPAGAPPVETSVLNPNGAGTPVAATTIVPVTPAGFTVRSVSGGHVVVDLLGWFTGPAATESSDGLFVPMAPERVLDTRAVPGRLHTEGRREVPSPFPSAAAIVTNVTAVGADRRGFVTAHPAGTPVPGTSTVNPSAWNDIVANLAITRTSTRGTAYWSYAGTDLIVDVTGWFTGAPVPATEPPPRNQPRRARVLLVGDSTLASLDVYTESVAAFVGFDAVVDAAPCRRLVRRSCLSDTTGLVPNTAVEAILGAAGTFDVVVVKAGYNDWFSDFPTEFDAVVQAARAKGAHTILWLTYNEDVSRPNARRAYEENNADLRWLATRPQYADVLLADWPRYSRPRPDWFADGTHLGRDGTWSLADYVSRWIAAIEHRPCPRPWAPGLAALDPCPVPEALGPVPDVRSLY